MVSFLDPNVIAYLATLFLAIPLLLFILRKILKNVPKNEFVALYGSILFWANFIYFVCEFVIWRPWFAWYLPIPFIPLLIFCCSCCLFSVATRRPERLTVDEYQNLYEKIKATGPTLLTGKMIQTAKITRGSGQGGSTTTRYYDWEWCNQFVYKTWKNQTISGVEEVESLLSQNKTFIVKMCLEINPGNSFTKEHYFSWHEMDPVMTNYKEEGRKSCRFLEEVVTTRDLAKDYHPINTWMNFQLPHHVSKWTDSKSPESRFLINQPWWIKNKTFYIICRVLLLTPVFRFFIWIRFKTVEVKFVKTFSTDVEQDVDSKPFKDNLEGFCIKHFERPPTEECCTIM